MGEVFNKGKMVTASTSVLVRAAMTLALSAITLKVVNLILCHMSLEHFELLSLC